MTKGKAKQEGGSKPRSKTGMKEGQKCKPKPLKLTPKQRLLVKGIAEGKNQKEAAKAAGVSETYASGLLKKPELVATIQELMSKHGLDDVSLLKKHSELLDATKTVSAVSGRDAGADSVDFVDVPDWQARAKGLEMAYKLKGAFTEKREVSGINGSPIAHEHKHELTDDMLAAIAAGSNG
jgi:hypothetical protein